MEKFRLWNEDLETELLRVKSLFQTLSSDCIHIFNVYLVVESNVGKGDNRDSS